MSSILNNPSALSALQALRMTQQALSTVENQVSTGLAVSTAADNSSYWSIATQLNNNSGIVAATNTALSEGQSVLATASSAINSVITTLNAMATALTEAQNPGANIQDINTSLESLSSGLTDSVTNASFNGLNVLNGSYANTTIAFVSGYNASAAGGTVTTIALSLSALSTTAGTTATDLLNPLVNAANIDVTGGTATTPGTSTFQIADPSNTSTLTASDMLTAVNDALAAVTNYAAAIGATQNRMTTASTFNSALTTNYADGVSGLVDADMNTASTRLQALQTQEQLGIQSLSVANQNAALILKLFS